MPGSRGAASYDLHEVKGVIKSKTCLLPMVTDLSRDLLVLGRHYHSGKLAFSGGLLEQPNLYLEAMELIPNGIYGSK